MGGFNNNPTFKLFSTACKKLLGHEDMMNIASGNYLLLVNTNINCTSNSADDKVTQLYIKIKTLLFWKVE